MKANECKVQDVLNGTKVFVVPLFQRRYNWQSKQWQDLWTDVLEQYAHPEVVTGALPHGEGHFLGSIVIHPAPGPSSTVARYLVIDGQQRLTTLLALLAAVRDFRSNADPTWDPAAYTNQYLSNPFSTDHPERLVPTKFDQNSYLETMRHGRPAGAIGSAYEWFQFALESLQKKCLDEGGIDFTRLERAILLRLIVVEITTSDVDNINNIFNTVNSKGLELDPVDLIRNHIFMQLPQEEAEKAHAKYWLRLEERLSDGVSKEGKKRSAALKKFMWAYLVRFDQKATQKDLFSSFETRMGNLARGKSGPELASAVVSELSDLDTSSELFVMVDRPQSSATDHLDPRIRSALIDISRWGSETHLPVTLEILWRHHHGRATADEAAEALRHVMSFQVRRSICGIPTNNLNRIFSGMVAQIPEDARIDTAVAAYLSVEQRYWPSDEEVLQSAPNTPIYVSAKPKQVHFLIAKIEHHLWPKEPVDTDSLEVEHVMPQTITDEWIDYLQSLGDLPSQTLTRLHTLGNLTLSGNNEALSNLPFEKKSEMLSASTMHLNQEIAHAPQWSESEMVARAGRLAAVLLEIFPKVHVAPMTKGVAADEELEGGSLADVLLRIPAGSWTTAADLAELLAVTFDELEPQLNGLSDLLVSKVLTVTGGVPDWLPPGRVAAVAAQMESAGSADQFGWAPGHNPHRVDASELATLMSDGDVDDEGQS